MRNMLDKYIKLLNEFYGEKFLFNGIEGNYEGILKLNNSIIKLKEPCRINEAMIKYRRALGEGCKKCEKIFNEVIESKKHSKLNFYDRPMEFPGFYKSLDFNKDHVKDIMIIGEAAGPSIVTHINCTYGLSNTEIGDDGRIETEKIFEELKERSPKIGESLDLLKVGKTKLKNLNHLHNNLWERLAKILPDSLTLEIFKSKVYITDLVKCNATGNDIWEHFKKKCFESFLIHEISIINPKLIIFLGNSGYDHLKKLKKMFEFKECCPTKNIYPKKHPEYEKYKTHNFRADKHLKKYYDNYKKKEIFENKSFSELTEQEKDKLIRTLKTVPSNFPAFGTISFTKDLTIKFIKIFHNSDQNNFLWNRYGKAYKDFIDDLVKDKVITL